MHWLWQRVSQMTQTQLAEAYDRLAPCRKAHIDRFRRQADRDRSLTGQWLMCRLLQQHWGMEQPVITRQDNGRPVLRGSDLHISIAHSGDLVVCAADCRPVGIDVEQLQPFRWALAEKVCTDAELEYVLQHTAPQGEMCMDAAVIRRFYEIWTGKEAWFKMLGTGIQNLKSVEVLQLNRQNFPLEDYWIQIVQG